LARYRQECFLAKKVLAKIDAAILIARKVREIKRAYAKHIAGAFRIGGGDDRSVNPEVTSFMKVAVNGLSRCMPNPGDCPERIGSGAYVGDLPEDFKAVSFGWMG
jgi:hypothetical protein